MIVLAQRVEHASVEVNNNTLGSIKEGILALVGFEKDDANKDLNNIIERILNYRIFSDYDGKMNLSVRQVKGGLLLVPQFTLAANTKKGLRPSFASAMPIPEAMELFGNLVEVASDLYDNVAFGEFGAHMKVSLLNDGPVTFTFSY